MNVGRCLPQMWGFMWGDAETLVSVPEKQNPAQQAFQCLQGRVMCGAFKWLYQAQLNCPFDSRPTILNIEFIVDAFGVCAHRAQSNHKLIGDLRPRKLGLE